MFQWMLRVKAQASSSVWIYKCHQNNTTTNITTQKRTYIASVEHSTGANASPLSVKLSKESSSQSESSSSSSSSVMLWVPDSLGSLCLGYRQRSPNSAIKTEDNWLHKSVFLFKIVLFFFSLCAFFYLKLFSSSFPCARSGHVVVVHREYITIQYNLVWRTRQMCFLHTFEHYTFQGKAWHDRKD